MSSNNANTNYSTVLAMCQMMLKQKSATAGHFLKNADILAVVDEVTKMPTFADIDKNRLSAELQERFTVVTGAHQTLGSDVDHKAWLPVRRSEITWRYWDRYRLFLEERVPSNALESLDKVTNEILARIEDPQRPGEWDRRGLVMGHVQSGKTANYSGLVCKAADAGYKVIIVLSGIHNSLRSQTQIRIDEGFLGFMSEDPSAQQTFRRVGVGLIDSSIVANTGTNRTQLGDFNEDVAKKFGIHPGGLPLVFVVKKHVGVLGNLIKWIRSCADAHDEITNRKYVRNVPALIVDDESDLASVDTKQQYFDEDGKPDEDHNPTKTNQYIRLLLRSFEKAIYVGYTATPFANIYIHDKGFSKEFGDDLFPRSFIVNIPAPSNYMGPARIFGINEDKDAGLEKIDSLPVVRTVSDHAATENEDETHGWMPPKLLLKTEHDPKFEGRPTVPPKLREAIMAFLVATAVRKLREKGPLFNTMLIHVVRYTKVQKKVAEQVQLALKEILQRLRIGDGNRTPTIAQEFKKLWDDDFVPTRARSLEVLTGCDFPEVQWQDLFPLLEGIASGMKLKIVNGSAGDILDYEEHKDTGMDAITIGGDKLSRGLTFEGLTVSYFLRSSKMYDTLMQMGRWFGYREKYIDVCRLYTTTELLGWFTHIAAASEELQRDFEHMANVGGTPKEYGHKVRSHPVMLVTSAVKMRNGFKMELSFSGDISETTVFDRDEKWLIRNFETTEEWLASIGGSKSTLKSGGYSCTTSVDQVLEFLGRYKTSGDVRRADTDLLIQYIKAQRKNNELVDWTVFLASSGVAETPYPICGHRVGLLKRAPHPKEQGKKLYTIRRLVNPVDESFDLSQEQRQQALQLTIENWEKSTDPRKSLTAPTRPNGKEARQFRDKNKGLLLLYPLDPKHADMPQVVKPIVGLAISFPKSDTAKEITYTVNNVYTTRGGDDDSL